ncbi:hypothetical protein KR093_010160, partial [Drosophila rubida]
ISGNYLLATILCLALSSALAADIMEGSYNVTQVCTMVKNGIQLGSIESCDYYYVCTKTGPVKTSCSSGYSYNYKTQNCMPSSQVECYYGLENPCAGKSGSNWVPNVNNCQGWFYCNGDKISGSGSCDPGQRFESASQRCIYGKCQVADSDALGPSLVNFCSVVPPNIYFGATDNCQTWYYCNSNGVQTSDNCKTSAFIVSTGECGYSNYPGACDRVVQAPVPTTCTQKGVQEPDPTVCGNYYICDGSSFELYECPLGTYYDVLKLKCINRQSAVPVTGCNRCQDAPSPFVNAVDAKLCNSYYYCRNGEMGTISKCGPDSFFNEQLQACADDTGLPAYVNANGACYGAKVPDSDETDEDSKETQ